MPKLLLSVRSTHEANLALEAGVDLIDIKEPSAGALGAASPQVIGEILRLVNRRCPTSVACGELLQSAGDVARQLTGLPPASPATVFPDYAKAGLAGCGSVDDWPAKWRQFQALLPPRTAPVAVVYADWREADAPSPSEVIEQAKSVRKAVVLIDTFDKSGPGLLRLSSLDVVRALIQEAHGLGMPIAVAGQLTFDDAVSVALLGPDYVGVRGGVCPSDRNGDIDREKLAKWQRMAIYPDEAQRLSRRM